MLRKTDSKTDFYIKSQKDKRESLGYYKEKIKFILEETGEGKLVLDVGCNDGFIGEMLIKKQNKVFGLDIVKNNLEIAESRGLIVKNVNVEKEKLPFKNNYFDVVILGDIIEHVFDTDRLLREARRILKTGGKLIVTTPNIASLGRRIMLLFGISPFIEYSVGMLTNNTPSVGHIRYYTVGTLRKQLDYNGFKVTVLKGNVLNLYFLTTHLFDSLKPSICMMIMCAAIKRE